MEDYTITHGWNFIEENIPSIKAQGLPKIAIDNIRRELKAHKNDLMAISNEANELIENDSDEPSFDYAHAVLYDITSKISIDFINHALLIL